MARLAALSSLSVWDKIFRRSLGVLSVTLAIFTAASIEVVEPGVLPTLGSQSSHSVCQARTAVELVNNQITRLDPPNYWKLRPTFNMPNFPCNLGSLNGKDNDVHFIYFF